MARADRFMKLLSATAFTVAGVGLAAYATLYTVDGGERAVIWDMSGIKNETYGEGTHFYTPIKQRPYIFDIRTKPKSIKTTTGTKDLQQASITLRVLYKPNVKKLPEIFKQLGMDFDERVLPSIGNETLKAVVAQYNAEELITQREQVSEEIRKIIQKEGERYFIDFVDISITDLTFGKEFTQAVENKQVAQQDAERQKFIVEKSEQEKQAAIIRAEGESEAARLITEQISKSGQGLIELRRIEAAREIAVRLASSKNITYVPASANFLFVPQGGSAPIKQ